jgi:ketosteroid isomerase-like protein
MSQEQVEIVKQLAAAWNRDDLDAFLDLLDPDIVWNTSIEPFFEGTDSVFRGHDGIRQFWESYRGEAFERLEVRMTNSETSVNPYSASGKSRPSGRRAKCSSRPSSHSCGPSAAERSSAPTTS